MSGVSHDLQAKSNFVTQLCPDVRPGRCQEKIARFREPTGRLAPLASPHISQRGRAATKTGRLTGRSPHFYACAPPSGFGCGSAALRNIRASMNHCYAQAINANTPSRGASLSTTGRRRSSNWDTQTTRGNTQPRALGIIKQPGPAFRRLAMLFLLARLAAPVVSVATTIWTGPVTTFTDVAGSDPTLPANQDRLTPNVWITRGLHQGIYNAKTETGFAHFFSPADTQWADGTTANYSSLSYTDWNTWAKNIHGGPPSTVGVNAVVHLVSDDIYLDLKFTSWGVTGGGFSYQRSTPPGANTPPQSPLPIPLTMLPSSPRLS